MWTIRDRTAQDGHLDFHTAPEALMLLYLHEDHKNYWGQDGHLDFRTAPEL